MKKTTMIALVAAAILGIGITAAYAGPPKPLISLNGDVGIDGDMTCVGCVDSQDIQDGTITSSDVSTPLVVIEKPHSVTMDFFTTPADIDWQIVNPGILSVGNIDFGSGETIDVSEFRKVCMRIKSSSTGGDSQIIGMGITGGIFTNVAVSSVGTLECIDVIAPEFSIGLEDFDGTESGAGTVELYLYLSS